MKELKPENYVKILEKWVNAAKQYFYYPNEDHEIMCYGTGESYHWAVQTNMNAFSAFAVLATSPELDKNRIGCSRDEIRSIALKLLRYSLRTHHSGHEFCTNDKHWGHSWISVLALERMMHGYNAIEPFLQEADKLEMRKILESESNELLDNYKIQAGIASDKNKPESNIWNGSLLLRTALYYPDTERKTEYLQKATKFFLNGISLPKDKNSNHVFSGKAVKDWHIGPNFTENFSLNHHGYMNVGYMVICLSNIAMLHFSLKEKGVTPPPEIYFHAKELWQVIKKFTFADGRLLRIGGDTRARYCYCQDYAVPMWLLALDKFKDKDALQFESSWLPQVAKEMKSTSDCSFLGKRLQSIQHESPFYFTRLEGDRAVSMSYGAYWRRKFDIEPEVPVTKDEINVSWQDEFHGASMVRGKDRIASMVWSTPNEIPISLITPPDKSNMVEWEQNLCSNLFTDKYSRANLFKDKTVEHVPVKNKHFMFEGGFINFGSVNICEANPAGEGDLPADSICQSVVFAALPDGKTAVCLQFAQALRRIYLPMVKGLCLKMPNDVFNDNTRLYCSKQGKNNLCSMPQNEEILKIDSKWLNIDKCLSVFKLYGDDHFTIYRPNTRSIEVYHRQMLKSLYVDEICSQFDDRPQFCDKGQIVIDTGAVLITNGTENSQDFLDKNTKQYDLGAGKKVIKITGTDSKDYLIIANFTNSDWILNESSISGLEEYKDLTDKNYQSENNLTIANGNAKIMVR